MIYMMNEDDDDGVYHMVITGVSSQEMNTEERNRFLSESISKRAEKRFDFSHPLRRSEKMEIAVLDEENLPVMREGVSRYKVKVVPSGSEDYQV